MYISLKNSSQQLHIAKKERSKNLGGSGKLFNEAIRIFIQNMPIV